MALTEGVEDFYVESGAVIDKDEADYMLPLTSYDKRQLSFALQLASSRASVEGDDEALSSFDTLYKRIQKHGVIEL